MSLPLSRRALVLDLDFTLLHLEHLPGSLEVPGRTRSAWIAPETVELLRALQERFSLVLATARSWDGTRWVIDGLFERGVEVWGVVLEDGARLGFPASLRSFDVEFEVEVHKMRLENDKKVWPHFEWQLDFKSCLVARCNTTEEAAQLSETFVSFAAEKAANARVFRDGRKVYLLPRSANKWGALQSLLGESAAQAAGVGDGANDLVWLPRVALPATFAGANLELVEAVRERGGIVSRFEGHVGIADILRQIEATIEHR